MVGVVYSEKYLEHDVGPHPECPDRLRATLKRLKESKLDLNWYEPEPASPEELQTVHSLDFIHHVREKSMAEEAFDLDTGACLKTFEVAKLAAGGALRAGELVKKGEEDFAFALIRPPGHHACPERAMGFCYFNNVAVAVRKYGGAVLDWDLHHGNGVQEVFYREPILYCSLHQWGIFPGTGSVEEAGEGEGKGYTLNVPLPAGTGDPEYLKRVDEVVERIDEAGPEILFVSAGFDAHHLDPIGGLELSTGCFGKIVEKIRKYPLVFCLEGGYDLGALADSVHEVLRVCLEG